MKRELYESTAALGERYEPMVEHIRTLRCGCRETMVCTICKDGIILDARTGRDKRLAFFDQHEHCVVDANGPY